MRFLGCICLALFLLTGCSSNKTDENFNVFTTNFNFNSSTEGWKGGFADYLVKDSLKADLKFEYSSLPVGLGSNEKSLKLTGYNQNTNLFLFIQKKITDLKPNTDYTLVFEVQLAFETEDVASIPGNVYLKVGALTQEPKKIVEGDSYRIDIDKGVGEESGRDMVVIGTISSALYLQNYSINENNVGYKTNPSVRVRTNDVGELWIIIGADSFVKGKTTIYYTSANVVYSVSH